MSACLSRPPSIVLSNPTRIKLARASRAPTTRAAIPIRGIAQVVDMEHPVLHPTAMVVQPQATTAITVPMEATALRLVRMANDPCMPSSHLPLVMAVNMERWRLLQQAVLLPVLERCICSTMLETSLMALEMWLDSSVGESRVLEISQAMPWRMSATLWEAASKTSADSFESRATSHECHLTGVQCSSEDPCEPCELIRG
mmetsp:Transcript_14518/g.22037  ORF Transcript_14518/g.22037 Transcript_14518/m.22037 type:complete len:200 (-) Transcript_14518:427-1026(-)